MRVLAAAREGVLLAVAALVAARVLVVGEGFGRGAEGLEHAGAGRWAPGVGGVVVAAAGAVEGEEALGGALGLEVLRAAGAVPAGGGDGRGGWGGVVPCRG